MIIKLWLARDKSGALYLYNDPPKRNKDLNIFEGQAIPCPREAYPLLTWEDSPLRVEI